MNESPNETKITWTRSGATLRGAREQQGTSLRELARRVQVSAGHLSQIERGLVRPSVSLLYSIVSELHVSLDSLFDDDGNPGNAGADNHAQARRTPGESRFIQRASERRTIELVSGVQWQLLTPTTDEIVDFREIIYDVGGGSTSDNQFIRHSGREYGLILQGMLKARIEFEEFVLGEGDTITLDSTRPHRFWNEGPGRARAVWFMLSDHPMPVAHPG